MNTQHQFVAERAAAQHCAELIRRIPEPADPGPALARMGERLAQALGPLLGQILDSDPPAAVAQPAREMTEHELAEALGPLAANCLLATGLPGVTVLAAIDGQAVLRLVDRAFGGKGEAGGALPQVFPLSAQLLIERLETAIAGALGTALGTALNQGEVRGLRRAAQLSELAPFPAGAKLTVLAIELCEDGGAAWRVQLALPTVQLGKLLGGGDAARHGADRLKNAADPSAAPFSEMTLQLCAQLVDMQIPLRLLSALEPGAVLPVAVNRAVPLGIGGHTIAHGTIGAADDRIAVRLTQLAD